MRLTRRQMLKAGLIGGASTALPVGAAIGLLTKGLDEIVESPPVATFAVPLRIPPVLRPVRSTATTDFYEITQQIAQVPILPGPKTTMWTYNGLVPGPTIVQKQGRDVRVLQKNRLQVPTTVHLHGGDVRPEDDGHPEDLVPPGRSKEYFYPGLHPPANLWYHDHSIHVTGRNVYMGLAALYPTVSDAELALPLPKGRFEVPLIIQDKFFLKDNSIVYPVDELGTHIPLRQGVFGDVILVNGTPKPFFKVARRKYRFRVLNGSNARIYRLRLSTGDPFIMIQTEGGFMKHPVETRDIVMSPSERNSFIIDFSKYRVGQKIVLENRFEEVPGDPFDPAKTRQIMRFDVVDDAPDPSSIPNDLPTRAEPDPADSVRTRDWRFERGNGQWQINEKVFETNRIDAFPKFGTTEIWRFTNNSGGWMHPIHPHLVEYNILDRNGKPPQPWERGPKDSVLLGNGEAIRVVMRFVDFKGVYVFHCHNVEHEDNDMMTQFKVV